MKKILLTFILILTSAIAAMANGHTVTISHTNVTCFGMADGTATASASGGVGPYSYSWTPIGGTDSTATGLSANTYTVTVIDQSDLSTATASVTITEPTPLTANITGITTICKGETTLLTASGGGTYMWNTGETTATITVSPIDSTSYTVTLTNGGCTGSDSAVVTVLPPPIITISGASSICLGQSTTLTASGGGTYFWNPSETDAAITVSSSATNTYVVIVTNAGCTASQSITVTVSRPEGIAGNTIICNGSTALLTALGGAPYLWSTGETTATILVSPTTYTNYILTETIGGCYGTVSVSVGVSVLGTTGTITGITVSDSIYKESCLGTGDGAIDITILGSNTGPFTYLWNNWAATQDITNVISNNYTVIIVDTSMNCLSKTYTLTPDGSNCGNLSGKIVEDKNKNCINDTGDVNLDNIMVTANPGNYTAYTNNQGNYVFNALPYGSYTLTQQINSPYIFPTCTTILNATLNSGNNTITNLNFLDTVTTAQDVAVYVYSSCIVPGFSGSVFCYLDNLTNAPISGTLCVVLPTGYGSLITSASPSGYSVNGDTVCWAYSNLTADNYSYCGTSFSHGIKFTVPVGAILGSTFKVCATAIVTGGNVNATSNNCYERIVTGSFDPNDKSVNPIGEGPEGNITLSDNTLDYHIRFQNTGNGPAVNIVVKDTLSDKLDISTLEVTSVSHNYILDVMPGNVLRWKFNNIMLADSGSNEPASHGWITYRVKQKLSNQIGDQIKNTAYIYFDFNPAVVTNTTLNTIATPTTTQELISTTATDLVKVYPNPFSDNTTFVIQSTNSTETYSFELIDVLGKQVKSIKEINTTAFQISRNGLPNGIYFYKIYRDSNTVGIGKLVVR